MSVSSEAAARYYTDVLKMDGREVMDCMMHCMRQIPIKLFLHHVAIPWTMYLHHHNLLMMLHNWAYMPEVAVIHCRMWSQELC